MCEQSNSAVLIQREESKSFTRGDKGPEHFSGSARAHGKTRASYMVPEAWDSCLKQEIAYKFSLITFIYRSQYGCVSDSFLRRGL